MEHPLFATFASGPMGDNTCPLPSKNLKSTWEYETHKYKLLIAKRWPYKEINTYCISAYCDLSPNHENHSLNKRQGLHLCSK